MHPMGQSDATDHCPRAIAVISTGFSSGIPTVPAIDDLELHSNNTTKINGDSISFYVRLLACVLDI